MSETKPAPRRPRRSQRSVGRGRAGRRSERLTPAEIVERLGGETPVPDWRPHQDPVGELMLTLLSQNTSDTNSGRAFQELVHRYPTWDAVEAAPVADLEATIRPGGLAKTKAPRLQALLGELRARLGPERDASTLGTMPTEEAKGWLTSLPGVGPKTASCVLLFALGRPALPVDTHVHRVSQRLGLIGAKVNAVAAHTALEAQMPPDLFYPFHVLVIRHGRRVCKAPRPLCEQCILADRCPSAFAFEREAPSAVGAQRRRRPRRSA